MEHPTVKDNDRKTEKITQKAPPAEDRESGEKLDAPVKPKVKSEGVHEGGAIESTKTKVDKSNSPSAAANVGIKAATAGPPLPSQSAPAENKDAVLAADTAGMVEMGGGLPALPPRPLAPVRQAMPSASVSSYNAAFPQRVPNVKQVSKPQFNIPPGSDLGAVGKIGVYQMTHRSSATDIHANLYFWVYMVTIFTTYFLIKRK